MKTDVSGNLSHVPDSVLSISEYEIKLGLRQFLE